MKEEENMVKEAESRGISGGASEEHLPVAERARVTLIRGIQSGDLNIISRWAADPDTRGHLDFAPEPPANWDDETQVEDYISKFEEYYRNKGEPEKITPIVTVNSLGKPTSVLNIRWRGDPYVPRDRRIASIESFFSDPQLRRMGIGKQNLSAALDVIFNIYKGYGREGESANEARLWVFTDEKAGNYSININFFRQYGFENLPGNWREYAAKREIPNVGDRDAMWFKLTREKWDAVKEERPELAQHPLIDLVSLRL